MEPPRKLPVLIVHGMWDSAARVAPLTEGLRQRGFQTQAFDQPSRGHAPIAELAAMTAQQVDAVCRQHATDRIDLVGFSMGALNARYYLQRLGGRDRIRRFISISGPHRGTLTAHALPYPGIVDMRPGSRLIRDLERDADPWGDVEVHCIYTPLDITIVPAKSSELRGARSTHRVVVPVHRWMISDRRVLDLIAKLLR